MLLEDLAFIEIWVDDAHKAVEMYRRTFGFESVAMAGADEGFTKGRSSFVLTQGAATLVLTSSISDEVVGGFVELHGDSVRDVAFAVKDARAAFEEAVGRGATPIEAPREWSSGTNRLIRATVSGFGDVVHSLVERHGDPNWWPLHEDASVSSTIGSCDSSTRPFTAFDHVAMCLESGTMDSVAEFYKAIFDFEDGHREYVETDISGMNARVVQHGPIQFPLQEPLQGNPTGPIAEFIDLNRGSGVYHVGLLTNDICDTLRGLGGKVKVLDTPDSYYDMLPDRVGKLDESVLDLRKLGVLVDRDESGYLLQTFTRSLHERRTFFVEVIQRKGKSSGFGSANIKALFNAVEADRIAIAAEDSDGERTATSPN